jgi:hypothetical protein
MTIIKKAVLDRFEGQQAVLLVDEMPMAIPHSSLPDKVKEGDWLQVEIEEGRVLSAKIDLGETKRTAKRIAEKLERLRRGEQKK